MLGAAPHPLAAAGDLPPPALPLPSVQEQKMLRLLQARQRRRPLCCQLLHSLPYMPQHQLHQARSALGDWQAVLLPLSRTLLRRQG